MIRQEKGDTLQGYKITLDKLKFSHLEIVKYGTKRGEIIAEGNYELKNDTIDASFDSLDHLRNDGTYTFVFNGKMVFFISIFNKTSTSFAKEVMETDFYKSL